MKFVLHILRPLVPFLMCLYLTGCGKDASNSKNSNASNVSTTQSRAEESVHPKATNTASDTFPTYTYEVIHVWPHDRSAFTQGLIFLNGVLLESTGLRGKSSLRKVELETGNILKRVEVPSLYFAEGLTALNGKLFQLTWKHQKGFVYDLESFQLEKSFAYSGEGWGLTTDGHWLIMSDGTDQIRFLDPNTFEEKKRIHVVAHGKPINKLNELEYINGEIFANVWGTSFIIRIDPATGKVTGVVDFTDLLSTEDRDEKTDVLNGIAYNAEQNRLIVTGKRWPKLFEVRLKRKQ